MKSKKIIIKQFSIDIYQSEELYRSRISEKDATASYPVTSDLKIIEDTWNTYINKLQQLGLIFH